MLSIFKKDSPLNSVFIQMLIIIIAFVIMGLSSYLYARHTEQEHLAEDAENTIALIESELTANILELETFLYGYSETIRSMLLNGNSEKILFEYMVNITDLLVTDRNRMVDMVTTHGYFFNWGGKHLSARNLIQPVDLIPEEQSWFISAVNSGERIVISEPYTDPVTGNIILTFSRFLTDNNGDPLAVICLDIRINRFFRHANINLTESSYGILLNEKLDILAYQDPNYIGIKLENISKDIAQFSYALEAGNNIYNHRMKNMFNDSIVYFVKVKHNWFLGIVIPVNEYYISLNRMAIFLVVLCTLLAWGLCTMLYHVSKAKLKSDKLTQQKSSFLATVSHEIRTPLNAILGMTEIEMQNPSHTPSSSEAFIKINNSGKLLLNIINDILDLSKIESGKLELVPVKYEVTSLINDIIQLNYIRYENKPIEFKIEVDENIPALLIGDELRIKQILNNLLSNAFKYTDKGEILLTVNAECIGRGGGGVSVTLIFQIKDTGQGMTPEQVNKLFDEYTRFNMKANRTTEGAGLGMTITRNLIDLMYGKINIKSAVGEGTTVIVRLPQKTDGGISGIIGKKVAENFKNYKFDNAIQLKKSKITYEYMPYGYVLIVDDVETNLYVAKGLMASYGLKIDLAASGFEAIDKIKEGICYDIIFMDHMMPKMDGMETVKIIRNMGYELPIVALTANAVTGQAEMFLNNGFNDFISKPIDIRLLNVILNKLIRDKQPQEVIEAAHNEKIKMEKKPGYQQVNFHLAEIFARDAKKAIKIIESCMQHNFQDEEQINMYIINVHAMKSALANIGETELSAKASRLEQAGREKDINVILSETEELLEKLKNVINEINKENIDNETTEDSEDSLAFLNEKLEIIKKACESYDKKHAKNVLNELKEKKWSKKTKDLINLIAEHLLHSEFDETLSLIDKNKIEANGKNPE